MSPLPGSQGSHRPVTHHKLCLVQGGLHRAGLFPVTEEKQLVSSHILPVRHFKGFSSESGLQALPTFPFCRNWQVELC